MRVAGWCFAAAGKEGVVKVGKEEDLHGVFCRGSGWVGLWRGHDLAEDWGRFVIRLGGRCAGCLLPPP